MSFNNGDFTDLVASVREAFKSGKSRPLEFRVKQLCQLKLMLTENQKAILEALHKDLRKPPLEALLYEIQGILTQVELFIKKTNQWAKSEKMAFNVLMCFDSAHVRKEPYGVVLVLSPWNYPFILSLLPVAGAICAGNCVVLKPSEISAHSANLMASLIHKYLDTDCFRVVLGQVEESKMLLKCKFDYIFFTGSNAVGQSIMQAATVQLTPVTLELGGKCPCYIDDTADFEVAARRIIWGKTINMGQTCIAPDYVICSKFAEAKFVAAAKVVIEEWHGLDLQASPELCRVINSKHWQRLRRLLDDTHAKIAFGGGSQEDDLWIEPTILVDVPLKDVVLQEEIFGPILPIVTVFSVEDAIKIIKSKPHPIALYTFGKNETVNQKLINGTRSGGVCINDVVIQMAWPGIPFGGVGPSGMGNYMGKHSFSTFTHERSVLHRSLSKVSERCNAIRYPPFRQAKVKLFAYYFWLLEWGKIFSGLTLRDFTAAMVGLAVGAILLSK